MRLVIAGGPRTGKTELASLSGLPVKHTDDLVDVLDWSGVSWQVSVWLDEPGPWLIEGVAVPRALRKWLAKYRDGKPCDRAIWIDKPLVALTTDQERMAKGCLTVWREILPELVRRGVLVE